MGTARELVSESGVWPPWRQMVLSFIEADFRAGCFDFQSLFWNFSRGCFFG